MNTKKQLELTRKRNFELNKTIDSLKSQMESNANSKDQGYAHAKALITELEQSRANGWRRCMIYMPGKMNINSY